MDVINSHDSITTGDTHTTETCSTAGYYPGNVAYGAGRCADGRTTLTQATHRDEETYSSTSDITEHLAEHSSSDGQNSINMRCKGIAKILDGIFLESDDIAYLNLYGNNIRDIRSGAFEGLGKLLLLNLGSNVLTTLDDDVFSPLHSLQQLLLGNNRIIRISPNAFRGLSALQNLELSDNYLVEFPLEAVSSISSSVLKTVYVSSNNISEIPSGIARVSAAVMQQFAGNPLRCTGSINTARRSLHVVEFLDSSVVGHLETCVVHELAWQAHGTEALRHRFSYQKNCREVNPNASVRSPTITILKEGSNVLLPCGSNQESIPTRWTRTFPDETISVRNKSSPLLLRNVTAQSCGLYRCITEKREPIKHGMVEPPITVTWRDILLCVETPFTFCGEPKITLEEAMSSSAPMEPTPEQVATTTGTADRSFSSGFHVADITATSVSLRWFNNGRDLIIRRSVVVSGIGTKRQVYRLQGNEPVSVLKGLTPSTLYSLCAVVVASKSETKRIEMKRLGCTQVRTMDAMQSTDTRISFKKAIISTVASIVSVLFLAFVCVMGKKALLKLRARRSGAQKRVRARGALACNMVANSHYSYQRPQEDDAQRLERLQEFDDDIRRLERLLQESCRSNETDTRVETSTSPPHTYVHYQAPRTGGYVNGEFNLRELSTERALLAYRRDVSKERSAQTTYN
ncbi:hypothetical protein Bbelb_001230 [Branchiostoma belcheri]|nr:hypothetical protein Bbelb_001230 [Branchiostoma belcheri]